MNEEQVNKMNEIISTMPPALQSMGTRYFVELTLTEQMLGTIPYDKKIFSTFVESKKPPETKEEESDTVDDKGVTGYTGFHKDEKGLFILDYMIRGFLKNSGNTLKDEPGIKIKALKSKISKFIFVFPRQIYFDILTPDGINERPVRGQTPQGERTFLAKSDFISPGRKLYFVISMLSNFLKKEQLELLLQYGYFQGLGQFRSGSFGRFSFRLWEVKN